MSEAEAVSAPPAESRELRARISDLEQALARRTQEVAALHEVLLEINSQPSLATLLNTIVKKAAGLLGARMGGLYLMQPDGETLELVVNYNLPSAVYGAKLRLGEGLSGQVAKTGQPLMIEDYHGWPGRASIYADIPFRRVVGVPLKVGEQVIGVIDVSDDRKAGPFSEDELRLVNLFADQAASAVVNARLYEAAQRELAERTRAEQIQAALYRISEAAHASQSLDELYRAIHQIVNELMPAKNLYIALYDEVTDLINFPYIVDELDDSSPVQRPGKGLTAYVLRTGLPLFAPPDVFDEMVQRGEVELVGAPSVDWLGVPLKVRDKTIGVLAVQMYAGEVRLTEEHKDLLVFVSSQVAMAIQRKRSEEALRDSERRFRDLFAAAQRQTQELGLLDRVRTALTRELDLTAIFRTIVTAIAETFGYTLVSLYMLEGETLKVQHQVGYQRVFHQMPVQAGIIGRTARTGRPAFLEDVHADPDFLEAIEDIVSEVCVPLFDQGEVVGVLNVESTHGVKLSEADLHLMMALSEHIGLAINRARLYTEARENAARLSAAFESLPFDFWVTDRLGCYVMQNSRNIRKWGNRIGRHYTEIQVDENIIRHWRRQHERVLAGETFDGEFCYADEDGPRWYYEIVAPVRNGDRIDGTLGVRVDVTDRHRMEEALRDSEERYRILFESNPHPMWAYDLETLAFLTVNDAAVRHYGYSRDEFLNMTIADIRPPEDVPALLDNITHTTKPLNHSGVWRHCKKDGSVIEVEITSHVLALNGRPARIVLANDVTERRLAEEALRRAQKMESLGILAGGIAHDFNNLLVAMLGQTSLALTQLPLDSPAHAPIEKAVSAAQRAADLTRQLLAYSGRGQFERRPFDLNALIRENLHLFEVTVPKNVQLRSELTESLPPIEGDTGQLQQVIMNLIINAVEAVQERPGVVMVRTCVRDILPEDTALWHIDGGPLMPGRYVALEVQDDGVGMSADTLSRIFDPFFSTKFTGRGLGLAAVLGIVRGHRGGLRVSSEVNMGTTFRIVFPMGSAVAEEIAKPEIMPAAGITHQGVLVIDDEAPVREAVTDILELEEIPVITAPDGQRGIELYRDRQAGIGLVLLDISMPGLSGEQTFHQLRTINPQVPVILSSGYSQDEVVQRFAGQLQVGFIQKPYEPSKLVREIRRWLGAAAAS